VSPIWIVLKATLVEITCVCQCAMLIRNVHSMKSVLKAIVYVSIQTSISVDCMCECVCVYNI
jgi:hypothetical protein